MQTQARWMDDYILDIRPSLLGFAHSKEMGIALSIYHDI